MAARTIHLHLEAVALERAERGASQVLGDKVEAVKAFQQRRFARTYADLLTSPRYGAASRYFLAELYGPGDFAHRDAQVARLVPALVRLFPPEIVDAVAAVARLHELSERLDTATARAADEGPVDGLSYLRAWLRHGGRSQRQAQIESTADIAIRLDRLTQRNLLRTSLALMRVPAHAAGLGDLQRFLETGFEAFRAMRGADEFIGVIRARERTFEDTLFAADLSDARHPSIARALALLP